jgi:nucleotide-binding universal stress UspA family protein
MQRLAICFDGIEDDELVTAALPWIGAFERVEAWCAYGDLAARELAYIRHAHGRPPPPPRHGRDEVDRRQAEAIAEGGAVRLRAAQVEAEPRILGGRDPGHALAEASGPDVALFLAAGHRGGSGPPSVGHVARFAIDHARGPVIVVRLAPL